MLNLNATSQFKKDRRRCVKRGYNMDLLDAVVDTLLIPAPLPPTNKDHPLTALAHTLICSGYDKGGGVCSRSFLCYSNACIGLF